MKEIRTISAAAVLRAISAGNKGRKLMHKFGLSEKEFHSVINQLLAERQKRGIQILEDWRSGLTVVEIANRHGFLADHFNNILNQLDYLGFFSENSCNTGGRGSRCRKYPALGRRAFPRLHHPVLTTRVYEVSVPEKMGLILDLSERGIGVSGIESQVGQEKVMFMNVGDFVEDGALTFECRCRWISANDGSQRDPRAGFEITSISENGLGQLKIMLSAEVALTRVA